jgi:hypothetical protein
MRFETRYDTWLVTLLAAVGLILFGLPLALYSTLAAHGLPIWPLLPGPAIFVLVLFATLPQYYEVREEGLYIRQGWKKTLLSYSAICELRVWNSALSAAVFSTHRLMVTAVPGGQFVIAVAEQERFLAEIARRSPQLEESSSGLKARGGSPVLC